MNDVRYNLPQSTKRHPLKRLIKSHKRYNSVRKSLHYKVIKESASNQMIIRSQIKAELLSSHTYFTSSEIKLRRISAVL